MPGHQIPTDSSGEGRALDDLIRRTARTAAAGGVVVVVVLSAIALYASLTGPDAEPSANAAPANMVEVAPGGLLAPEDVPPGLAAHYQSAQDHPEIFSAVPCFCGCEEMLGHRHLGDCFVRPDGRGLEAHALGCGVCLGEAQQVMDLIAGGTEGPDEIRDAVVAEWSDPYLDP